MSPVRAKLETRQVPTDDHSPDEIRVAIRAEIVSRLESAHGRAAVLSDDQTFEALGLGSLDLLELVDRLETVLAVNPFEGTYSLNDVRTVGDLCAAYRVLPSGAVGPIGSDDVLLAARKRARERSRRNP